MPESVRWLLSNGRIEEAKKVIELAARANRKQIPHHLIKQADLSEIDLNKDEKAGVSKKKITVLELFRTRIILLRTLNMCFQVSQDYKLVTHLIFTCI